MTSAPRMAPKSCPSSREQLRRNPWGHAQQASTAGGDDGKGISSTCPPIAGGEVHERVIQEAQGCQRSANLEAQRGHDCKATNKPSRTQAAPAESVP